MIMKTHLLLAHVMPRLHDAAGILVFLILLCLAVSVALVFAGSSEDQDK